MLQGISSQEAAQLLAQYGQNVLSDQKKRNFLQKFLEQFNNFLVFLLLGAAAIAFYFKDFVDGWLILTIVFLNAMFGLYQEKKAEEAVALLKKITTTKSRVLRDGQEVEIDSRELVPGDVIYVEEGSSIPADAKIIEAKNLEINEATLTGESLPVLKKDHDEVFMGTTVSKGRGHLLVTNTGMRTRFGEIASSLSQVEKLKTPLQIKLENLSKVIGIVGIIISAAVFGLALVQGTSYYLSFLLAISLAVAVVPEGLPAVLTLTLAIGVREMAKRKAIVRKLSAIEALGSVTLIATDKTGTLTTNKMDVDKLFLDEKLYSREEPPHHSNNPFQKLLLNGILCSTASLVYVHDRAKLGNQNAQRFDVLGDPTEGALLVLAQDMGLSVEEERQKWKIIKEQPFDPVTKRMSVVVRRSSKTLTFTKGAPEAIIEICDQLQIGESKVHLTAAKKNQIKRTLNTWTKKGYRVLAFAYEEDSKIKSQHFTFLGMVALHDPLRPEAKEAIHKANAAGIKVVMITGDNEQTAESVATSAGMMQKGDEILTGKQVDSYSDQQLLRLLPQVKIFARTTPFHKKRIVVLYQQLGEIVAVTGDGVNDAIALKQANVGVAMGLVGTDVARETADMVITDDNFATIVNAIEEGRHIVKNLKSAITYLLTGNFSEALSLVVALVGGIPALFYPIQLLYINLVSDGMPAIALAFSPRDSHIMQQSPQKVLTLLDTHSKKFIGIIGILSAALVIFSFFIFRDYGRTAAFVVLAILQSFILISFWLSHQSMSKSIGKVFHGVFLIAFLIPFVGAYIIVSSPTLAEIFHVQTLSFFQYALLAISSSLIYPLIKAARKLL